jgi:hypothetical protein
MPGSFPDKAIVILALATLGLWGCEFDLGPAPVQPVQSAPPAVKPPEQVAQEAQAYAEQLGAQAVAPKAAPDPVAEVQWMRPGLDLAAAAPEPVAPTEVAATQPAPVVDEPAVAPPPPAGAPAPVRPTDREQLVALLWDAMIDGSEPALDKALIAAGVSLAEPHQQIDPRLLTALPPADRDLVGRYHGLLVLLKQQLEQGESAMDRLTLTQRLDELYGEQPIMMRRLELCRRVTGYGVYEPFAGRTLLAGREQKMVLYVEVENFHPTEPPSGEYEVKLTQEVMLFNESDGLAVWRHDPVQIVDVSKNRRRDFFVVQLIALPARLGVGKYRLKVRITDLHGGSIDEMSVPLEMVADAAMVAESEGKTPTGGAGMGK